MERERGRERKRVVGRVCNGVQCVSALEENIQERNDRTNEANETFGKEGEGVFGVCLEDMDGSRRVGWME